MSLELKYGATTHNSAYVHRRPFGAARATRRCDAPLRHIAPRTCWAQGHVTYVPHVIRHCVTGHLMYNNMLCDTTMQPHE